MQDVDVPVLIAGGSLVGLSTAVFLGAHGIPSLVVERHRGTAIHPRAAIFSQRTIEIYRTVGLEASIRDAAEEGFVQNGGVVVVDNLGGRELEWYLRDINEPVKGVSPVPRLFITQNHLEPILRTAAEQLGARTQYSSEVTSFEADEDGVTVAVRDRDGGNERTVRARYLIGADGNRSPTRNALGIGMQGRSTFSNSLTIYFRADVSGLMRDRPLSVIYVVTPRMQGFIRVERSNDAGFLALNAVVDEAGNRTTNVADDPSEERCLAYVREALGDPDIPIEIDNVQHWAAAAEAAERLGDGRVFLVGDAAHTLPPTGGFGGNTGVQDAHNIAWKLAAVLKGTAGPELLATYDAERRPVADLTVRQAFTRYVQRIDPGLADDSVDPFIEDATVEIGYRYRSTAIVTGGDDADLPACEDPRQPSADAGMRAPHVPLKRGGATISTIDLTARRFALLAGPEGERWCKAAEEAADQLGADLVAYRIGPDGDFVDADGAFAAVYRLNADGAVLVRPDGFIAWRSDDGPDGDGTATLAGVLEQVLARRVSALAQ